MLVQHPRIAAVGICAVPDDIRGDEVMACIVPDTAVTAADLDAFARDVVEFSLQRLAYFKAPGYVAICDALRAHIYRKDPARALEGAGTAAAVDAALCRRAHAEKRSGI